MSKRCLPLPSGLTFRLGYRQLPRSFFVDQPEAFIVEASDGLKVGKWEVKYPGVDAQFALAGIDPQGPNHWSKVGCE